MEKENLYNRFQTEVKNKDAALFTFMQRVLCMTSKMFVYTGTPETMPPVELERILQTTGNVGFPVAVCVALFYYMEKQNERHQSETDKLNETVQSNTKVLTELCTLIKTLIK